MTARKRAGLPLTPLEELENAVREFFARGLEDASRRFRALQSSVLHGELVVELGDPATSIMDTFLKKPLPWNSCKLAATLVLLLACSTKPDSILCALKFLSRGLGGLPTMETISTNASADFSKRFAQAKKAAIDGKMGKVTVLGVNLVDVEMLERGEKKSRDMLYTSFAHSFVVAVGREGFRIYQAWGEHGYRLDEYLKRDDSRCRDWVEGKKFVKKFDKLARYKRHWDDELYNTYKECFGVDLRAICGNGKNTPQHPIIPVYRPWVRIFEIEDVQVEYIKKFQWRSSP